MVKELCKIFIFLLLISGCSEEPGGYDAIVGEEQEINSTPQGNNYIVDAGKSVVTWIGTKPTGRHTGTFDIKDGKITLNDSSITSGIFTIKMNSVTVLDLTGKDKEKLTSHLKSPDFFDLENYPLSRFEIVKVEEFRRDNLEMEEIEEEFIVMPTHIVTGNFSMRGKTLSITFPAEIFISENIITAEARFNIDRTRWGVSWGNENFAGKLRDVFAHNTVIVGFEIIATPEEVM